MKNLTTVLVFSIIVSGAFAQKSQKKSESDGEVKSSIVSSELQAVYDLAVELGDYDVAKATLIEIIANNPEKKNYLDSLARIYYAMGAYPQALVVAEKYMKTEAATEDMLEIKAASQRSMNMLKESLLSYETLYSKSKNLYHAYQVAVLQYNLKRLGECIGTIGAIEKDPGAAEAQITINYGQGQGQQVPMLAALENLKGVINLDLNQKEQAKVNFEAALKLYPEFELAKNNLTAVNPPPPPEKPEKK